MSTNHDRDLTQTRRRFLASSLGAAAIAPLAVPSTVAAFSPAKKRLLILGGTSFLGPAIIDSALARGHEVVLFNRGKTNAELYPELEKLRGDRNTNDLAALAGRKFDAYIDTSGYVPAHVAATAKLAAENAAAYVFVSTVSVYPRFGGSSEDVDETSETGSVPDDVLAKIDTINASFREGGRWYGGLKALCEAEAEKAMPGRVANLRPGLIVGPRDSSDRFTWWPVRVDRGGEVLAPGNPQAKVQVIDVRDLGEWCVRCVEDEVRGVYNAVGFQGTVTMQDFLGACRCATSQPVEFVWADDATLQEHEVGAWMEMPLWIPGGRGGVRNERAIAKGLGFRPLGDTIRDTLAWAREEAKTRKLFGRTGIAPEKEAKVIAAAKAKRKG